MASQVTPGAPLTYESMRRKIDALSAKIDALSIRVESASSFGWPLTSNQTWFVLIGIATFAGEYFKRHVLPQQKLKRG
jgi:hypothetical protein